MNKVHARSKRSKLTARKKNPPAPEAPAAGPMTLDRQTIRRLLSEAIDVVVDEADSLRGVAASLRDSGSLSTSSAPFELRSAAGVIRCHAMGMLLSVVQIAAKAEKIMTMADVSAAAGGAK